MSFPPAIIPRPLARLNARSRNSDVTSGQTTKKTSSAYAVSSHEPSTHKALFIRTPPASLPSSAYSATNHRSSHGRESLRRFQLLTTGSGRARKCGTQPTSTSSGQCGDIRPSQMLGEPQLPSINLGVVVHPRPATPPTL